MPIRGKNVQTGSVFLEKSSRGGNHLGDLAASRGSKSMIRQGEPGRSRFPPGEAARIIEHIRGAP
jgi:hypothetical protein